MQLFLDNIELWLSAAGVLVILGLPRLLLGDGVHWMVMALTALVVGVLHGLIFWVIRRRQRRLRAQAVADLRAMLKDIVNNQLTVILGTVAEGASSPLDLGRVRTVKASVKRVTQVLETLSWESLKDWQSQFAGGVVPSLTDPERAARKPSAQS